MKQQEIWNKNFSVHQGEARETFVEQYLQLINHTSEHPKVLDLGCGDGITSLYLKKQGFDIIAADFSCVALEIVKKRDKDIPTICFDMIKEFPFDDCSLDVIIANLSTHYFTYSTTERLYNTIYNKLKTNGLLLLRVNSKTEFENRKKESVINQLEKDYYLLNNGKTKRYFSTSDMDLLLCRFLIIKNEEVKISANGKDKYIIECIAKKLDQK